jgi:hypothetical protein
MEIHGGGASATRVARRWSELAPKRLTLSVLLVIAAPVAMTASSVIAGRPVVINLSYLGIPVGGDWTDTSERSLTELVRYDVGWAAAVLSFALLPLWFLIWRRSAIAFGRAIGLLWSAVVAASVGAMVSQFDGIDSMLIVTEVTGGTYPELISAAVMIAIAFGVAPPAQTESGAPTRAACAAAPSPLR